MKTFIRNGPGNLAVENLYNFDDVLDTMFEGVYVVDPDRRIQKWNAGATSLTGFTANDVLQRRCSDNILLHVDDQGTELCTSGCPLHKTLNDGTGRQATVYLRHKLGYRVPVLIRTVAIRNSEGEVIGALEAFREIGEAEHWKARLAELEEVAFIDLVTGIPNRRFLETHLVRLLQEFHSTGEPLTFCMLDVDHFKSANDLYGHEIGDRVLRSMGQTLLNCLRHTDLLGRWGGDEFVLLLASTGVERAKQVAERARVLIAETATPTNSGPLRMSVSIGAVVVAAGEDRASLIHRVDQQLYIAKSRGRNCWSVA